MCFVVFVCIPLFDGEWVTNDFELLLNLVQLLTKLSSFSSSAMERKQNIISIATDEFHVKYA